MIDEERLLWLAQAPANKEKEKMRLAQEILNQDKLIKKMGETLEKIVLAGAVANPAPVVHEAIAAYRFWIGREFKRK